MKTGPFLAALEASVTELRTRTRTHFAGLDEALFNQRPAPNSWSILECLEHLNRYSRYYNAAFAKALAWPSTHPTPTAEVRYTWLGRKSVEMMRPTNAKKSTTLKHLNPLGSCLGPEVLNEFDQHQSRLLTLLAQAHHADLNCRVIPVEFFRLLNIRLGEALEFVVVHQQRHMQQAMRVWVGLRAELAC